MLALTQPIGSVRSGLLRYPRSRSFHTTLKLNANIFENIIITEQPKVEELTKTRAGAHKTSLATSQQKLKEVCRQVRGMSVTQAIRQLEVNKRVISKEVLKTIKMASNNAKNLQIPTDDLVVSHLIIGRGTPIKRIQMHAKGGHGELWHRKTHLTVYVEPASVLPGRKWEYKRQRKAIKQRFADWRANKLPEQTTKNIEKE